MNKINEHAKHPKASMALGCCTLCWGILAAVFIFSGGIAITNLSVEDAYFSSPQQISKYAGQIKKSRNFDTLKSFISSADVFARLKTNASWELCYGYDANKLKPQVDSDECSINRIPAPKCGMGEGVGEAWGQFKNYDPNDIENLLARMQDDAANLNQWQNKSVADFEYRPSAFATVANAGFTLQASFALLAGILSLLSTFQLTEMRKILLVVMLFTLTTSTYNIYGSATYYEVQDIRSKFRNCAGLPNETYYSSREVPECRVKNPSLAYEGWHEFFSPAPANTPRQPSNYEGYQFRCDLIENPNPSTCNNYCEYISADIPAVEATNTTRAKKGVKKGSCVNMLMDGYGSWPCTDAQLVYWKFYPFRICQEFGDQVEDVTIIDDARRKPCVHQRKPEESCLMTKGLKCTTNQTKVVQCQNVTHPKHLPLCTSTDYTTNLEKLYDYYTPTTPKHDSLRSQYEPCSEEIVEYLKVGAAYSAYWNIPRYCVTDNRGGNEDSLAGSFLARAAVLDWGISMVYAELFFLLLTILHGFYCTTAKPDS